MMVCLCSTGSRRSLINTIEVRHKDTQLSKQSTHCIKSYVPIVLQRLIRKSSVTNKHRRAPFAEEIQPQSH